MIKVQLTKGMTAILDDGMEHLSKLKWFFNETKKGYGYARRLFYIDKKNRENMAMHHAVIGQPLNGLQVDHINGNRLDNRLENLRFVTARQNSQNQKCHRSGNKSSRFIGVSWDKQGKRWLATIRLGGKKKHLGLFYREEDAAKAYIDALNP